MEATWKIEGKTGDSRRTAPAPPGLPPLRYPRKSRVRSLGFPRDPSPKPPVLGPTSSRGCGANHEGASGKAYRAYGRGYSVTEEPVMPEELCLRLKGLLGSSREDEVFAIDSRNENRLPKAN